MGLSFNTHDFFTKGYTWGILEKEFANSCRDLISSTNFIQAEDNPQQYPDWMLEFNSGDEFYYEILRSKMSLETTPSEFKNIGNTLIETKYFDSLREKLVKPQFKNYTWTRAISPHAYGLWNKTEEIPWHTDINDGSHMTVLLYFNKRTPDSGCIHFGVEDEFGNIEKVYSHKPIDQTFVCVNSANPYFKHSVDFCDQERFVMSYSYRFI
jgi:hypothetical protein